MIGSVSTQDPYDQWATDTQVLAEIRQALSSQSLRVQVRIPRTAAEKAARAWERDDGGPDLSEESPKAALARKNAAALALIGLAVRQLGVVDSDDVVVKLDAWSIGIALDVADKVNGH